MSYEFTTDWFSRHTMMWEVIIDRLKPQRILEIGSFEGRSTTFIIEHAGLHNPLDIYCVDSWRGGVEHAGINFDEVMTRFDNNVRFAGTKVPNKINIYKVIGTSLSGLSTLAAQGNRNYDLTYVDGSHVASDVFFDAAMAFQLTRVGGAIIFDDYREDKENPYVFPKIAIDSFIKTHKNKIKPMDFKSSDGKLIEEEKLYQRYYWKISE